MRGTAEIRIQTSGPCRFNKQSGEIRGEVETKARDQKHFPRHQKVQRRGQKKTLGGCDLMAIWKKAKCFEGELCMYLLCIFCLNVIIQIFVDLGFIFFGFQNCFIFLSVFWYAKMDADRRKWSLRPSWSLLKTLQGGLIMNSFIRYFCIIAKIYILSTVCYNHPLIPASFLYFSSFPVTLELLLLSTLPIYTAVWYGL